MHFAALFSVTTYEFCTDYGSYYTYCDDGYYCCGVDECWQVEKKKNLCSAYL